MTGKAWKKLSLLFGLLNWKKKTSAFSPCQNGGIKSPLRHHFFDGQSKYNMNSGRQVRMTSIFLSWQTINPKLVLVLKLSTRLRLVLKKRKNEITEKGVFRPEIKNTVAFTFKVDILNSYILRWGHVISESWHNIWHMNPS